MAVYVGLWLVPEPTLLTMVLAGALTAALLAQFGWKVEVYKKSKGRMSLRVMNEAHTDLHCGLKDENASQYLSKRGPLQGAVLPRACSRKPASPWADTARSASQVFSSARPRSA